MTKHIKKNLSSGQKKIQTNKFNNKNQKELDEINNGIARMFTSLEKLIGHSIKNTTIIPDKQALFMIVHTLILKKSFWMLFLKKTMIFYFI